MLRLCAVLQPHCLAELLPGEALVFVEGMAVDVQGGTGLRMAQQTCHCAHIHTLGDEHTSICVPLRYNYDKPEKPRISRVFGYLARFFILFQTEKSSREVVIS